MVHAALLSRHRFGDLIARVNCLWRIQLTLRFRSFASQAKRGDIVSSARSILPVTSASAGQVPRLA